MSSDLPLLTVSSLCMQFSGGVEALRDIDLRLEEGEFLSLLGPSGCGKSTLLRLIAGLMAPVAGKVIWRERPQPRHIGMVFQEPTLMPWLTAIRNVEAPLRIMKTPAPERRARAAAMLARVGLERFSEAYPRTLSGGMKMRVAIARALVTEPRVLLLDEPFAALDEFTRHQLNDDLLRIREEEKLSVVFVTHSAQEAVYLSDRILMMSARPGTLIREMIIDAPPGRQEAFRHSAQFNACCAEISATLRQGALRERVA